MQPSGSLRRKATRATNCVCVGGRSVSSPSTGAFSSHIDLHYQSFMLARPGSVRCGMVDSLGGRQQMWQLNEP